MRFQKSTFLPFILYISSNSDSDNHDFSNSTKETKLDVESNFNISEDRYSQKDFVFLRNISDIDIKSEFVTLRCKQSIFDLKKK